MMTILINIIDWLGTILIIIAAFYISSKKNLEPKIRIKAFSFYIMGCTCLIFLGSLVHTYGLIVQQIILMFFNMRGLIHGIKDLRRINNL